MAAQRSMVVARRLCPKRKAFSLLPLQFAITIPLKAAKLCY